MNTQQRKYAIERINTLIGEKKSRYPRQALPKRHFVRRR